MAKANVTIKENELERFQASCKLAGVRIVDADQLNDDVFIVISAPAGSQFRDLGILEGKLTDHEISQILDK